MAGSQHSYFENPSKNLHFSLSSKVIKFFNYKLRRALQKSMETVMDKLGLQLWLYGLCKIPKSKQALCNTSAWHKSRRADQNMCVPGGTWENIHLSPIHVDVSAAMHCLMHKIKRSHCKKLATWTCIGPLKQSQNVSQNHKYWLYMFFKIKYLLFIEVQLCYINSMLNADKQNSFCHFLLFL